MNHLISFLIGYSLGSIPTAYIVLKKFHGVDITSSGSGNVGAHNSHRVSKSKLVGIAVLFVDLAKGFLSVLLVKTLIGNNFEYMMFALIAAVFAHCYSPWISFNGGRGLATGAGGGLLLSIPLFLFWALTWLISFVIKNNVHLANFIASIFTAVLSFSFAGTLNTLSSAGAKSNFEFGLLVSIVMLIILSRHIAPIRKLFSESKNI